MRIYLDNAATTPIHPRVIEKMTSIMKDVYGNPSSIHQPGRTARTIIEDARKTVANQVNSSIGEIFFTGSATEANNMLLRRAVSDLGVDHIIISSIEHPCVLETAKDLSAAGLVKLDIVNVDEIGLINYRELESCLEFKGSKKLLSIMHVNNEIGVIQDIEKISRMCIADGALFHCDAVQALGKIKIDLQKTKIDFLSGTSHKFHGPKGVGFMYIKNDHTLQPLITGGGQERALRSGTENIYGIAGLAEAMKIYSEDYEQKLGTICRIKHSFKHGLKQALPDVEFIEDKDPNAFIPTILSVSFPENPKTELMTFNLDIAGISASAGSACASGVEQASHVLAAINFPEDRRAVRFSFSYFNTMEEVATCIQKIASIFS